MGEQHLVTVRLGAAISAMLVILVTGWLIISPIPQNESPTPLRVVLSIVLIFGIAFLAACIALIFDSHSKVDK